MAGGFEALAGFIFREQAAVDGALAGVVDLVGDAREVGIDTGELQVVVDLVEQVAEGGRVAIAGADEASELWREFLFDGLFKDGSAETCAGGEEAVEVAAGGFVEVAIGIVGAGGTDDDFAQRRGAADCGLDKIEKFEDEGGPEEIVLLRVECALDGLPCGGGSGTFGFLEARERGEALAGVLDEAVAHIVGETTPVVDEGRRVLAVAGLEFLVDESGESAAELLEARSASEVGDGFAELAARSGVGGLGEKLLLELGDIDGHGGADLEKSVEQWSCARRCAGGVSVKASAGLGCDEWRWE